MNIKVKSTKILKTGTNDYGPWELVKITTTEGKDYTTLAKEAIDILPGSVINITDMDKNEKGQESFKKFEILTIGEEASVTPAPPTPQTEMTPDRWAEKDRLERFSIESQTAYKGAIELATWSQMELTGKAKEVIDAALDWALTRLKLPGSASGSPPNVPPEALSDNSSPTKEGDNTITPAQINILNAAMAKAEMSPKDLGKFCKEQVWDVKSKRDLTVLQFDTIMEKLKQGEEEPEEEIPF